MKQKTRARELILCLFLLVSMLISLQPSQTAFARSNIQPSPTNAAELYLLQTLREGYYADLISEFPNEADRHISGEFFESLLKDSQILEQQEISIEGAIIEYVYAYNFKIPYSIYLDTCVFQDYVEFGSANLDEISIVDSTFNGETFFSSADLDEIYIDNSTFSGETYFRSASFVDVTIYDSTFEENVYFGQVHVSGSMDLQDNVFQKGVNFNGADIQNDFYISGSQILNQDPSEDTAFPANFWSMRVGHTTDFGDTVFDGDAFFAGSNFNTASFDGAAFNGEVDFTSFKSEDASFYGAVFDSDVTFNSASVETITLDDAVFNGEASFLEIDIDRYADINNTQFNESANFTYSNIGYGYFYDTVFNGSVDFYQMEVEGDAEFDGAEFNNPDEPSSFNNVSVGDTLGMSGIVAPAGLDLSYSDFGTLDLSGEGVVNISTIDLSQSLIGRQFSFEDATVTEFLADGLNVGGSVVLKNVVITDKLDLRNSKLGFMVIDNFSWPANSEAFNMRGMQFSDIDLGDKELTDETWGSLLMIVNQSAYSPQAYQTLSQFLVDKGHPDWAAEVDLAMKRRERNKILQVGSAAWLWSWFMDGFSNYGVHPELVFLWSGLVVAIGALVYRRRDNMLPIEQEEVQVEYNPVWYSFALFIPYIDLGIASKWEPDPHRKWARYYKYVQMLLGWILAPIALLTFGGVLG